jgi:hypothetical protein
VISRGLPAPPGIDLTGRFGKGPGFDQHRPCCHRARAVADVRGHADRSTDSRGARDGGATRKRNRWLARIIRTKWDGASGEQLERLRLRANQDGAGLTTRGVVQAVREAMEDRAKRDLERASKALWPAIRERHQAIEQRYPGR